MPRGIARSSALLVIFAVGQGAAAECRETLFDGVTKSVVADQMWVSGVPMWIADLSIDAEGARREFAAYWRRNGGTIRTQVAQGVEVSSSLKDGCLYALQIPVGRSGAPRLVISDLHVEPPKMPRGFEWPLAANGLVLTDSLSVDRNRIGRLLVYRTDSTLAASLKRVVDRLTENDWKIDSIMRLNNVNYSFSTRKGNTALDVTIVKDGSGSMITMNFSQFDS